MEDNQLEIVKNELIPLFLKSLTPLIESVVKKRLELFSDEIANSMRQQDKDKP